MGLSVSDERETILNSSNEMMMNRYVNLVCNFVAEDFVDPAIQENIALRLLNAKTTTGLNLGESLFHGGRRSESSTFPNFPTNYQIFQVDNN